MAGSDPLADLMTRRDGGLSPSRHPSLAQPQRRENRVMRLLRQFDEEDARREQAAQAQQRVGLGVARDAAPGMGDFRAAEQRMDEEAALRQEISADPEGWIQRQREELQSEKQLLQSYIDDTLRMDATASPDALIQRERQIRGADGTGGLQAQLAAREKWLAEVEEEIRRAMAQSETLEDPSFWQKAMGKVGSALEWKPIAWTIEKLAGPQEAVAGAASYVAEGLGAALGVRPQFDQHTGMADLVGGLAGSGAGGTAWDPDSLLRRRGRQFNKQVGRNLGVTEDMLLDLPVLGSMYQHLPQNQLLSLVANSVGIPESDLREMRMQLNFEIATDPLWLVDALPMRKSLGEAGDIVGRMAMRSETVADFVAKNPSVALWPKKTWSRIVGKHKLADVMGDPHMEKVHLGETTVRNKFQYEANAYLRGLKEESARILNDLNAEQIAKLREELPPLVEHTNVADRARLRDLTAGDDFQKALYDYADMYQAFGNDLLQLQQKWGLKVHDLVDNMNWFGRGFSAEVTDFLSRRPDARKILYAEKSKRGNGMMSEAWESAELGRKLKGMDFAESEAHLLEKLQKLGFKGKQVWERDPTKLLEARIASGADKAHLRNYWSRQVADALGETLPGHETFARMIARDMVDAERIFKEPETLIAMREALERSTGRLGAAEDVAADAAEVFARATERAQRATREYKAAEEAFQATGAKVNKARDAQKKARDDYFEAQSRFNAAGDDLAREAANTDMQNATQRLLRAKERLKEAKAAADPAAVAAAQADVARAQRVVDEARGAVKAAEDSASAARARVAELRREMDVSAAALRDAEAAALADKANWTEKAARLQGDLSDEAKAAVVMGELRGHGYEPPPGYASALELMVRNKAQLPDNIDDIAALAVRYISPENAKKAEQYASNHFWQHMPKGEGAGQWVLDKYDGWKHIWQKATLARVASLTKDMFGTFLQGLLANNMAYLEPARKAIGGTMANWREGMKQSDDVLRLKALGVLRTTRGEVLDKSSRFDSALLRNVEQRGVIGGTLKAAGAEQVGERVGRTINVINEARVLQEEIHRVAVFMKARAEGKSFTEAVEDVYMFFGKFDEMSKVERNALNRMFFFWSWMARSMPVALQSSFEHPVRARLLLTAIAGDVMEDENQPDWIKRMGGYVLGHNEDGSVSVLSTGSSSYYSPLLSALQSDFVHELSNGVTNLGQGEFRQAGASLVDAAAAGGRDILRSAPPFATAIGETAMNFDTFTMQPWWDDPNNRDSRSSNIRAPAAFAHFLSGPDADKQGTLERLLGLKGYYTPEAEGSDLQYVTMDPRWAAFFKFIPGLPPLITDAGSFADPRQADVADGISLGKGAIRHAGMPLYRVNAEPEILRQAREFRSALLHEIDKVPGNGLVEVHGSVAPNPRSIRGQQIRAAMDRLEQQAKDQNMGQRQARAWVLKELSVQYPEEAKWMSLSERLRIMTDTARAIRTGQELPVLEPGGTFRQGSIVPKVESQLDREFRASLR